MPGSRARTNARSSTRSRLSSEPRHEIEIPMFHRGGFATHLSFCGEGCGKPIGWQVVLWSSVKWMRGERKPKVAFSRRVAKLPLLETLASTLGKHEIAKERNHENGENCMGRLFAASAQPMLAFMLSQFRVFVILLGRMIRVHPPSAAP